MKAERCAAFFGILFVVSLACATASPVLLWQVGEDDDSFSGQYDPGNEFSQESGNSNPAPGFVTRLSGDPLYNAGNNPDRDDHYYVAGSYPPGFNGLTSVLQVPRTEPTSAFERALANSDPTNQIHFPLTAAQAGNRSRFRLSFELVYGGSWSNSTGSGESFGSHDIDVRFGNTLIFQRSGINRGTRFTVDIPASSVSAVSGGNTIRFTRTNPNPPSGTWEWIQFDFVKLEVDADAYADGDSDGLPRWWEEEFRLSDANAADAITDADSDGLNALQEYNGGILSADPNQSDSDADGAADTVERNAGSNPLLADTDGDGLGDAGEILGNPASSPVLADTDADGASDSWEKRVGSNPSSAASKPTAFAAAIGLNFVTDGDPSGHLPATSTAGFVPQTGWNNTVALRQWDRTSGSTVDIARPIAGSFTRANGTTVSGMSVAWNSDNNGTTRSNGTADQSLMNGYLRASQSTPISLTVSGIPFPNYHILAYVGANYDGQTASVRLNSDSSTLRNYRTFTAPPQKSWVPVPAATPGIPVPYGNVVRYTGRTDPSFTLHLNNVGGWDLGLHAIQIIDATLDADSSGIPDWYEMQYALQPATAATAAADPDGDGLTNRQEFTRGSDPRNADTDGDGLADGTEPAANVLTADSDGDGLGDYAETHAILPSNPSLADSDGDGISDLTETTHGMPPGANPSGFTGWVPVYSASPSPRWEWKLDPIQLVWDHGSGVQGGGNAWDDTLVGLGVENAQSTDRRGIEMSLRTVRGSLTYQFESFRDFAFSGSSGADSDIYVVDGNTPRPDLKSALGFSGYGNADISDRLRFRVLATRNAGTSNLWTLTFEIFNITRNAIVVSRIVNTSVASPALEAGTATWKNSDDIPGIPTIDLQEGVKIFFAPTALETLPQFAQAADSDNDGMPNAWENTHSLNPSSAADATLDADGDGLKNRDEFLAGTHPRLMDSDGDGIDDRIEREEGSNPLLANIRPTFAGGTGYFGNDFNRNSLADAWEVRYGAANLAPNADADADGASNATESAWGTDPFSPLSRITLALRRSGDDAVLEWTRGAGKRQRLHRSSDLSSWQALTLPVSPGGNNDTARVVGQFTSAPSAFFSVETNDRDSDGDGVSDWDEMFLGFDPYARDSTRSGSLTLDPGGDVTGSVSGDLASFTERFRGALPGTPAAQVTRLQAARFLQQASFGPTLAEIDRVQSLGFSAWIDDQISNQSITYHRPVMESMIRDLRGPRLNAIYSYNDLNLNGNNTPTAFARAAIRGDDQLRQRVAFALSQILVTSKRDGNLENRTVGMTDYYDIFVRHGLGNYRDVLREVTRHPAMGRYLSHIGNQKARPEIQQFPDENYARELMQLFTIGLWELNPDGTRKLANGNFIPTYDNGDITELARVFTGFWFGGSHWNSENGDESYTVPMSMWPEKHDFGAKSLLGDREIPARAETVANAQRDVDDALDFLLQHPNTAPFVSRQLIQYLVTSNPSPEYVARVSGVFADNGKGVRGDLGAVTKAILLDTEARDVRWSTGSTSFGRLKDPVYRAMAIARVGRLARHADLQWWDWGGFYDYALQSPGFAPSVFNFYRPDYRAPGLLTQNRLAGSAFQITNSYTSISFVNQLWNNTVDGLRLGDEYSFNPDYRDFLDVAGNPAQLIDRANLLICGGSMGAATRATLLDMLAQVPAGDPLQRVQLVVFLSSACPEGAIQR